MSDLSMVAVGLFAVLRTLQVSEIQKIKPLPGGVHPRSSAGVLFWYNAGVGGSPYLVITLCGAPQLLGQAVATGTVTGLITDESGAVVQGAKVELTDVSTGQVMSTITNDQGQYVIVDLKPGQHNLSVSKQGFAETRSTIQAKVGVTTTVNPAAKVGASTMIVEVQAAGTELQTMNSTVGNTITGVALEALPSIQRDV